jgi:hypothetical protein
VVLKPRFTRGGHTFEFPLLLSHDVRDVRVLLAAHLLPPLASILLHTLVVKPLWRRHRVSKVPLPCPCALPREKGGRKEGERKQGGGREGERGGGGKGLA